MLRLALKRPVACAVVAESDQRSAGSVGQDTIELAARFDTELGEHLA
jgi:hypothetical protein